MLVADSCASEISTRAVDCSVAAQPPPFPRLSSGNQSLWTEFKYAVSKNSAPDAMTTVELLRTPPTRSPGHTHAAAHAFVLVVPVQVDNVNPPSIPRPNDLRIDVDSEYDRLLTQLRNGYAARWHM